MHSIPKGDPARGLSPQPQRLLPTPLFRAPPRPFKNPRKFTTFPPRRTHTRRKILSPPTAPAAIENHKPPNHPQSQPHPRAQRSPRPTNAQPPPQSHARNRRPPTHHQPCPSPTPMEGDARHRQGLSTSHRAGRSLRRGAEPGGRGRCDRHPWLQRQARIRLAQRRAEQQQKSHGWDFCSGPAGPVRGAQAAAKPRPTPTTDPAHP